MLTEDQKTQFVTALENECGCGITEDEVISTRDTVQNFIAQWGSPHECEQADDIEVLVWHKLQTRKGATRGDLYVMDFGRVRAAYFSGEA
jgi:hypothetical protein